MRTIAFALACAATSGCSFVLDWDQRIDAGPAADECAYGEPNNTAAEAFMITLADMGPAAICPTMDHDFYRFTVTADMQQVTITLTFAKAMGDIELRLYDAADPTNPIVENGSFEDFEVITCPSTAPTCPSLVAGDYIFEAYGVTDIVNNRYEMAISIVPQ